MNWIKVTNAPKTGIEEVDSATVFRSSHLLVLVSQDGPSKRWHLSISHPNRYPTYEEIKAARYDLVPDHITMAMIFPPKNEFVNLHNNCFHLHEYRDSEIVLVR